MKGLYLRILVAVSLLYPLGGCCAPCKRRVVVAAGLARAPFDLVKDDRLPEKERVDLNGIPRNPVWGYQADHLDAAGNPYPFADPDRPEFKCFDRSGAFSKPECTTQQTLCDLPGGFNLLICSLGGKCRIRGHMNWPTAATYEGAVIWDTKAVDQDYNFLLYLPKQAGLTVANCTQRAKALGIEYDSREVIEPLRTDPQFWWMRFREAVDRGDNDFLGEMKGKFAIITGLMNLDCEHGCMTELHPVWAMAIHLKDDPADDVWIILARNWGNEGFCSSDQHYIDLPQNRFIIRLPWRNQASAVEVNTQKSKFCMISSAVKPEVTYRPNEAAFVKLTLPRPEDRAVVVGELHLEWRKGQAAPVNPVSPIDAACPIAAAASAVPAAEERLAGALSRLRQDPEKLRRYNERMAAAIQKREAPTTCTGIEAAAVEPGEPVPPATPPLVRAAADAEQAAENDRRGEALCLAFDNNIPGLPGVCSKRNKR